MALKYEESLNRVQDPRELEYRINEYGISNTARHYGISYDAIKRIIAHYGVKQDRNKLNERKTADLRFWFKANKK